MSNISIRISLAVWWGNVVNRAICTLFGLWIANSVTWPNYSTTIVSQRTALKYAFSLYILYDLAHALKLDTEEKSWCVLVTGVISEMFGWTGQWWGNCNKMYTYTSESICFYLIYDRTLYGVLHHKVVFFPTLLLLFLLHVQPFVQNLYKTKQTSPTHSFALIHIYIYTYICIFISMYVCIYCSTILTHINTYGWMHLICSISE